MEYINELAKNGQIALCFVENVLNCECGVEAVTSTDGAVFGQLSQPSRIAEQGALDVILAAVGYFKVEKEPEKTENDAEEASDKTRE
jgi:hypothetical protein